MKAGSIVRLIALGAVILALTGCGKKPEPPGGPKGELTVLCGAGIRPPMETIRKQFEREHNCTVNVNYGGSGVHLGQLKAGGHADLYIPGDVWWVRKAQAQGMVENYKVAAWFVPVIAVQSGNPKGIKGLADLARDDVRVGLGRVDGCAVGPVARDVLAAAGLAGQVKPAFEDTTVNSLADQVKLEALDAAIIWDAVAKLYANDIDIVPIEDGEFHAVPFAVAVLKQAKDRALAQAFAETVAGEAGAKAFRDFHYQVSGQSLNVRSGGSMREPINEIADLFEAETHRKVLRTFGDSGTLLLETNEAKDGDIYVCHDPYARMAEERGMSRRWYTTAYLAPTLAVRKGNPKSVRGLRDLLRDDVKVGVPHRRYSTCGQIIWAAFKKHGMYDAMDQRGPFESRSSGDIAAQLRLGTIDVAVMWDAIARSLPESIDLVPIEPEYKVDAITSATTGRTYEVGQVKVTIVTLTFAKEPLLAAQFARLAVSPEGRAVWARHGFNVPAGK